MRDEMSTPITQSAVDEEMDRQIAERSAFSTVPSTPTDPTTTTTIATILVTPITSTLTTAPGVVADSPLSFGGCTQQQIRLQQPNLNHLKRQHQEPQKVGGRANLNFSPLMPPPPISLGSAPTTKTTSSTETADITNAAASTTINSKATANTDTINKPNNNCIDEKIRMASIVGNNGSSVSSLTTTTTTTPNTRIQQQKFSTSTSKNNSKTLPSPNEDLSLSASSSSSFTTVGRPAIRTNASTTATTTTASTKNSSSTGTHLLAHVPVREIHDNSFSSPLSSTMVPLSSISRNAAAGFTGSGGGGTTGNTTPQSPNVSSEWYRWMKAPNVAGGDLLTELEALRKHTIEGLHTTEINFQRAAILFSYAHFNRFQKIRFITRFHRSFIENGLVFVEVVQESSPLTADKASLFLTLIQQESDEQLKQPSFQTVLYRVLQQLPRIVESMKIFNSSMELSSQFSNKGENFSPPELINSPAATASSAGVSSVSSSSADQHHHHFASLIGSGNNSASCSSATAIASVTPQHSQLQHQQLFYQQQLQQPKLSYAFPIGASVASVVTPAYIPSAYDHIVPAPRLCGARFNSSGFLITFGRVFYPGGGNNTMGGSIRQQQGHRICRPSTSGVPNNTANNNNTNDNDANNINTDSNTSGTQQKSQTTVTTLEANNTDGSFGNNIPVVEGQQQRRSKHQRDKMSCSETFADGTDNNECGVGPESSRNVGYNTIATTNSGAIVKQPKQSTASVPLPSLSTARDVGLCTGAAGVGGWGTAATNNSNTLSSTSAATTTVANQLVGEPRIHPISLAEYYAQVYSQMLASQQQFVIPTPSAGTVASTGGYRCRTSFGSTTVEQQQQQKSPPSSSSTATTMTTTNSMDLETLKESNNSNKILVFDESTDSTARRRNNNKTKSNQLPVGDPNTGLSNGGLLFSGGSRHDALSSTTSATTTATFTSPPPLAIINRRDNNDNEIGGGYGAVNFLRNSPIRSLTKANSPGHMASAAATTAAAILTSGESSSVSGVCGSGAIRSCSLQNVNYSLRQRGNSMSSSGVGGGPAVGGGVLTGCDYNTTGTSGSGSGGPPVVGGTPSAMAGTLNSSTVPQFSDSFNSSVVSIYDVFGLLPISKNLAHKYRFLGKNVQEICRHNKREVEKTNRKDLSVLWNVLEQYIKVSRNCDSGKTITSADYFDLIWSFHPLGRDLINSLVDHYFKLFDIQTAAAIICLLGQRPTTATTNNNTINNRLNSAAFLGRGFPIIEPPEFLKFPTNSFICSSSIRKTQSAHSTALQRENSDLSDFGDALNNLTRAQQSNFNSDELFLPKTGLLAISVDDTTAPPSRKTSSTLVTYPRGNNWPARPPQQQQQYLHTSNPLSTNNRSNNNPSNAIFSSSSGAATVAAGAKSSLMMSGEQIPASAVPALFGRPPEIAANCFIPAQQNTEGDVGENQLLDANLRQRFETIRNKYADILFCWRMYKKSAEVMKYCSPKNDENLGCISTLSWCSKCDRQLKQALRCNSCRSPPIYCIVCEMPCLGIVATCALCSHGGHSEHIALWFSEQSSCPSGCGCECKI